jgi:hypothetical protein
MEETGRFWKILFGVALTALAIALLAFLFFPLAMRPEVSPRTLSLSTLKTVHLASQLYKEDHDGTWPPAQDWLKSLSPFLRSPDPAAYVHPWPTADRILLAPRTTPMRVTASRAVMATRAEDPGQIAFFLSGLPGPSAVGGASDLKYANSQTAMISVEGWARVAHSRKPLPFRW